MDKYQKKQARLNSALAKVQDKLRATEERYQRTGMVAQNWNDLHDLEARIKDRLWSNWSDHKDAHWELHGWNAY
jgi:DNA repair exonuclease SbcCD ATPase subunit